MMATIPAGDAGFVSQAILAAIGVAGVALSFFCMACTRRLQEFFVARYEKLPDLPPGWEWLDFGRLFVRSSWFGPVVYCYGVLELAGGCLMIAVACCGKVA